MADIQIDRQEVAGTVRGYNDVGFCCRCLVEGLWLVPASGRFSRGVLGVNN